ncbi:MAG: DUF192 domain-containing protein [Labilithrix sp.]|nr:DUF192 domain-containing protein [Labilithrix sp.]MCW5812440.1 DUF192 domain-containing protein [Labilithrix sp.]
MRLAIFVGLTAVAACSRTPAEPEPAPPPVSVPPVKPRAVAASASAPEPADGAAPGSLEGRCVVKMADTAPRIPPNASAAACPPDPGGSGRMPADEITFLDVGGDGPKLKITAELARTPRDVERGLMYRRSMGDDQGMFFKLDKRSVHTFWMHNTCIALDMMFVDTDGLIVGIVEGAAPLTDTIRSVDCESAYVLEVNGGWSRKHGVQPGQRITIPFAAR